MNMEIELEDIIEELEGLSPNFGLDSLLHLSLLLYANAKLLSDLDGEDLRKLLSIGSHCIWEGGHAIFYGQLLYGLSKDSTFAGNPLPCFDMEALVLSNTFEQDEYIRTSPNPSTLSVFVSSYSKTIKYHLFSISGISIREGSPDTYEFEIDLESIPPGVYMIVTLDEKFRHHVSKLMVE